MPDHFDRILEAARELGADDRERLARELLADLDRPSPSIRPDELERIEEEAEEILSRDEPWQAVDRGLLARA
jgi:hypothetical protein